MTIAEIQSTNVLIVDDETPVRTSIRKKLSQSGYCCAEASNAGEALKLLKDEMVELVILDINMPGQSGSDILPSIRQMYPETAVIMSTATSDSNVIIECMKLGAQDYIVKPFDLNDVSASVERAMKVRKLELEIQEYQRNLEQKVKEQTIQIRKLFLGAIESLVSALEAKDKYTAGHSRRVTEIALAIGRELHLTEEKVEDLRWGSLLHDVGKIAIDPAIQNKPGKLTEEEYRHIATHSQVGSKIVKPVANNNVINIIKHHHDRYEDNMPNQTTRGKTIPLEARILAVADTFDAMTSDRPYRKALSCNNAIKEIKNCTGTQFDPRVVSAFLNIKYKTYCAEKFL